MDNQSIPESTGEHNNKSSTKNGFSHPFWHLFQIFSIPLALVLVGLIFPILYNTPNRNDVELWIETKIGRDKLVNEERVKELFGEQLHNYATKGYADQKVEEKWNNTTYRLISANTNNITGLQRSLTEQTAQLALRLENMYSDGLYLNRDNK